MIRNELEKPYEKFDVLFISSAAADLEEVLINNGHRVFRFDPALSVAKLQRAVEKKLYRHAVRDAVVLFDHPGLYEKAAFLWQKFGFTFIIERPRGIDSYENIIKVCLETTPKVSVVVLTYNNLALNKACIDSILGNTAYPNYELLIVDNDSSDGTKEYLKALSEQNITNVRVFLNAKNLGFAAGNNVGMKKAEGDYVILLNNDTIVTRGWMTSLVKHIEMRKGIGLSGPVTNSIGNEAKIKASYKNAAGIHRFAYRYTWAHMGEIYPEEPNVLAFFAVCISREVIEKCGFLDEVYGLGMFEDDDYCQAAKQAGFHLCIAEDAFVHHEQEASFNLIDRAEMVDLHIKNKEIFLNKWGVEWKGHRHRPGIA